MKELYLSGAMFDALPVQDFLDAAARSYSGIQIRSTHLTPETPVEIRNHIVDFAKSHQLKINALSCFVGNFALLDDSGCKAALERLLAFASLAAAVKTPLIRVWPGWVASAKADAAVLKHTAKWLRKAADLAGGHGVRLAMEMHHGTLLDCVDAAERLLHEIDRADVGLIYDPVNLYQTGTYYGSEAVKRIAGQIFDVHVKDIVLLQDDSEPGCFAYSYYAGHIGRFTTVVPPDGEPERYYAHRRIGFGGVDWRSVLKGLDDAGYQGTFTVESVKEDCPYLPAGPALAGLCAADWKSLTD